MLPTIATGNVASAIGSGYDVANSCRFNDGDSAYMHKTQSGGNQRTFTVSVWTKISRTSTATNHIMSFDRSGPRAEFRFYLNRIYMSWNPAGDTWYEYYTTALYRDPSAWMNIVVAVDTTQGTDTDRIKIYVNGVSVAFISSNSLPTEDFDTGWNVADNVHAVGRYETGTSGYFDGYMAEVCWIDGLALTPTSFGEFDEDSPTIWKPIDVSGLTFGTNGFYLPFSNKGKIHTLSASGDVHHETDQKKFGDTSIYFDGTGDALSLNDIGQLTFTGDFTFECWIRCGDQADNYTTFFDDDPGGHQLRITLGSSSTATPKLSAYSGVWDEHVTGTTDIGDDAWHHCAVVRDNGTIRIFVDGTSENTRADSGGLVDLDRTHLGQYSFVSAGGQLPFTGYLDEIRISSIARYTSNFTPSTSVFSDDEHTRLLIHSDTTDGSTTFTDSSGVAGGIGNDDSGNNNDFASTNIDTNTDQATDTPTNNFCTFNPLIPQAEMGYSEGNCIATDSGTGGNSRTALTTMAPINGKWYAEFKLITDGGDYPNIGIWATEVVYVVTENVGLPDDTYAWNSSSSGRVFSNNTTIGSTGVGTYAEGDIVQIAMDLDNNYIYFGVNGTYITSGDPTSGGSGTGGFALAAGLNYYFATTTNTNGAWGGNFGGCPPFAISSGNADGDGYGNFEYAVPSGYYALNTKNLAEYG